MNTNKKIYIFISFIVLSTSATQKPLVHHFIQSSSPLPSSQDSNNLQHESCILDMSCNLWHGMSSYPFSQVSPNLPTCLWPKCSLVRYDVHVMRHWCKTLEYKTEFCRSRTWELDQFQSGTPFVREGHCRQLNISNTSESHKVNPFPHPTSSTLVDHTPIPYPQGEHLSPTIRRKTTFSVLFLWYFV